MEPIERRIFGLTEVRADGAGKLVGYAAKFDVWSDNLGGFRERIAPGAFDKVLKDSHDVRALVNHEGMPFARSSKGSLKLEADSVGLKIEADVPESWGQLREALALGNLDQMSFGFRVAPGGSLWDLDADPVERTVNEVDELLDVSVVTFPAYPQTEAALRSLEAAREAAAPETQVEEGALPAENIRLRRRYGL